MKKERKEKRCILEANVSKKRVFLFLKKIEGTCEFQALFHFFQISPFLPGHFY